MDTKDQDFQRVCLDAAEKEGNNHVAASDALCHTKRYSFHEGWLSCMEWLTVNVDKDFYASFPLEDFPVSLEEPPE